MALELIAAIALGLGAAGIALLVVRLSRSRVSRTIVPVAAAAAMFGYSMWSDYSWAERTQEALPDSFVVTSRFADSSPLRPWTYLFPVVERFSAVDGGAIGRNPNHPGVVLVDVFLMTRRMPVGRLAQFVDCAGGRRAQAASAQIFREPDLERLDWVALPPGDGLLDVACNGSALAQG